jgi:ABC-type uncharacterized transport system auxiliary subunit
LALLAALALAAAGCGLEKPYPAINTFDVSPAKPAPPVSKVRPFVVRVSQLGAAAAYETRKLIYKSRQGQMLEDYYNELVAPPGRLLADSLATYLDLTSPHAQFVRSQGQRSADFVLEGYLAEFLGDFSKDPPEARIALAATLNDVRRERAKIVLARTYVAREAFSPARGRPAQDLSLALAKAYRQVILSLEEDLGEFFRGQAKGR